MAKFQVDVKELPSRGKYYNIDYIEMESLEVIDVFDISTSSANFLEDVLDSMIIENNVFKNISLNDVLLIDKDYLYLKLKEATFTSSMIEMEYSCEEDSCSYTNDELEIDIFEYLKVDQIPEDFDLPVFTYGKDKKYSKKLKFPTVGDVKRSKKLKNDEMVKSFYNPYRAFLATILSGDLFSNFEVISGKSLEGENFIPKDVKRFSNFVNKNYIFGIKDYIDLECPKCASTRRLPFQVNIDTFIQ